MSPFRAVRTSYTICQDPQQNANEAPLFQKYLEFQHWNGRGGAAGTSELGAFRAQVTNPGRWPEGINSVCVVLTMASTMGMFGKCGFNVLSEQWRLGGLYGRGDWLGRSLTWAESTLELTWPVSVRHRQECHLLSYSLCCLGRLPPASLLHKSYVDSHSRGLWLGFIYYISLMQRQWQQFNM